MCYQKFYNNDLYGIVVACDSLYRCSILLICVEHEAKEQKWRSILIDHVCEGSGSICNQTFSYAKEILKLLFYQFRYIGTVYM